MMADVVVVRGVLDGIDQLRFSACIFGCFVFVAERGLR